MSDSSAVDRRVRVPVKSRTTVGEEDVAVAFAVSCPVQGKEVELGECSHCNRSDGFQIRHGHAVVECRVEGDSSAPLDAALLPIATIMTTDVVCVRPDLSVANLEHLLLDRGISGAPVVDAEGRPVGVVSSTDVLRHHRDRVDRPGGDGASVGDIMTPLAFCLPANESIAKAAALMAFESVHRLPVVGPTGAVVGVISPLDLLRWLAREHGYVIGSRD